MARDIDLIIDHTGLSHQPQLRLAAADIYSDHYERRLALLKLNNTAFRVHCAQCHLYNRFKEEGKMEVCLWKIHRVYVLGIKYLKGVSET